MHGPFMDMAPGSPDRRIGQITLDRYRQAIRIAASLGVETLVFHANFIAAIRTERYRTNWHRRNVDFWGGVAEDAQAHGVKLAIENMWGYDPDIIGDVLRAIDNPALRACLDVGHAHLYSDFSLEGWLTALGSLLIHTHMNNNDGEQDLHRCLTSPAGVIDYHAVIDRMRALPAPPTITLEMDTVDDMRDSLGYFDLPDRGRRWRACAKPASTSPTE
jgi:sugar phosphate isomerase/epimerase